MIVSCVIFVLFIAGCVDYKAYDLQKSTGDDGLVNEIAEIEKELAAVEEKDSEVERDSNVGSLSETVEEVILPELKEEKIEPVVIAESDILTLKVRENELAKLLPRIVDADKDPINFTFSPPFNEQGQWKTNYGDAGEYFVTLRATDGKLTTEKKIKLVVERVNVPPKITLLRDLNVKEGQEVKFTPEVTDPNNDKVKITVSDPLSEGSWKTDFKSAGDYNIKVIADDGELKSEAAFKLTVTDVNQLPEIKGVDDEITIKEGETAQFKVAASDLDDDAVTVSISNPVGDDGIWETTFTDHGDYTITITANDGKGTTTKRVRLHVQDVNKPPEIVDVTLG